MKTLMEQSKPELLKQLAEKQEALRKFRFNIAGSKVRNMKEGSATRKEIARIMTVLNHPNYTK